MKTEDDRWEEEQVEELKQYAMQLDLPPQYKHTIRVKVRGQRLSGPTHWKGMQWAVTRASIERRDGTHVIAKDRLYENENKEGRGWITHMGGKTWVDILDLAEALRIARR
jgi:hypothetical protein